MKKKILFSSLFIVCLAVSYLVLSSSKGRKIERTVKSYERGIVLPEGVDSTYSEKLISLGFNNESTNIYRYTQRRKFYFEKYGLNFIGETELTKFLKDNDFICGESSRYIDEIPLQAGKKMVQNFDKIKSSIRIHKYRDVLSNQSFLISEDDIIKKVEGNLYECNELNSAEILHQTIKRSTIVEYGLVGRFGWFIQRSPYQIHIIGAAKSFNTTGMVIEEGILKAMPPKDPIAIVKVNDGWVELANW